MEKLLDGKWNPAVVGLFQSLLVAVYCSGVGAFIFYMGSSSIQPGYLGVFLMLVLFVFSAAVTGTLVFGLPVYLALKNKVKESLSILGFTLLYSAAIILITLFTILLTV